LKTISGGLPRHARTIGSFRHDELLNALDAERDALNAIERSRATTTADVLAKLHIYRSYSASSGAIEGISACCKAWRSMWKRWRGKQPSKSIDRAVCFFPPLLARRLVFGQLSYISRQRAFLLVQREAL
jgi:hypothetical protein